MLSSARNYKSSEIELKKSFTFSFSLASLFLLIPAFYFPVLKISKLSKTIDSSIPEIILNLFNSSAPIAITLLFVLVIAPVLMTASLLVFIFFEKSTKPNSKVYKLYFFVRKWMMLDVFVIAVFASMIKLAELVSSQILIGAGFSFVLWLLLTCADDALWFTEEHRLEQNSDARTFTYSLAALFLLVPANLLPIMVMAQPGGTEVTNLWASIMHLFEGPAWPIGVIVFLASFIGPWFKIFSLFFLSLTNKINKNRKFKRTLYGFLELIGRWSIIDIFIAAILVAMVQMNNLASVGLKSGSLFFTGMIILTLLASHSFNLREDT